MTERPPTPRDPRARRWTILLALLAIVVAGGVALRVAASTTGDEDRREGDQRSATTTEAVGETARDDGDPGARNAVPDEAAPEIEGAFEVEVATTDGVDGPTQFVRRLGPVLTDSQSSLPYVVSVLGEPDSAGPNPDDPNVCDARWLQYGLEVKFFFGQPPSPEQSCSIGPIAAAVMTGDRWLVGAAGLAVGDDLAALQAAFPAAQQVELAPELAAFANSSQAFVLAEATSAADRFPTLYATTVDDAVASLLYVSGAD